MTTHCWRALLITLLVVILQCLQTSAVPKTVLSTKNKKNTLEVRASKDNTDQSSTTPKESSIPLSPFPIILTSNDFSSKLGDGNVWLIEFHTPWCSHCRNFAASYNHVASIFHSSPQEGIRVGMVDCESEKALKARFGVSSFPSFYIVDGWQVYEFNNARSHAALMDFARGGYKKQDPIPLYTSPMGPMGLMQGTVINVGAKAMQFFSYIQEAYGVSPILAGIVISFCVMVGGMVSVVTLAIMTTPKDKNE